jgi:hypothetical protein
MDPTSLATVSAMSPWARLEPPLDFTLTLGGAVPEVAAALLVNLL